MSAHNCELVRTGSVVTDPVHKNQIRPNTQAQAGPTAQNTTVSYMTISAVVLNVSCMAQKYLNPKNNKMIKQYVVMIFKCGVFAHHSKESNASRAVLRSLHWISLCQMQG